MISDHANQDERLLREENARLRQRMEELETTLEESLGTVQAIREGLVDAVVIDRDELPSVLTLEQADRMYLRLAQEAANVGTFDWDFASGHIQGSEIFWSLLGVASASAQHPFSEWENRVFADDRQRFQLRLEGALSQNGQFRHEFRVLLDNEETHWLSARGAVIRDVQGVPGRLVGITIDITDRKRAEEELRRRAAEFQAHFNIRTVGNAQADPETGRLLLVNQALCELTGYAESELLSRTLWDITSPDDQEVNEQQFRELTLGQRPSITFEHRLVRK